MISFPHARLAGAALMTWLCLATASAQAAATHKKTPHKPVKAATAPAPLLGERPAVVELAAELAASDGFDEAALRKTLAQARVLPIAPASSSRAACRRAWPS